MPKLQRRYNECPQGLKNFLHAQNVDFQIVPPHLHRRNTAERAIGIWKDHLIAGLAIRDPQFQMHIWCRLIGQATNTLELLRKSRLHP